MRAFAYKRYLLHIMVLFGLQQNKRLYLFVARALATCMPKKTNVVLYNCVCFFGLLQTCATWFVVFFYIHLSVDPEEHQYIVAKHQHIYIYIYIIYVYVELFTSPPATAAGARASPPATAAGARACANASRPPTCCRRFARSRASCVGHITLLCLCRTSWHACFKMTGSKHRLHAQRCHAVLVTAQIYLAQTCEPIEVCQSMTSSIYHLTRCTIWWNFKIGPTCRECQLWTCCDVIQDMYLFPDTIRKRLSLSTWSQVLSFVA